MRAEQFAEEHRGLDSDHTALARELAAKFSERAGRHDKENSFPFDDFEDMRQSGYLGLTAPAELGGGGADLMRLCEAQEILAEGAPATALGVNMHLFTVGLAAEMWQAAKDAKLEIMLRAVAQGELIVGSSISEAETGGNNFRHATTTAHRQDGGFVVNGRKIFCSISPVMSGFATHALYEDPDDGPKIVHFMVFRDTPGLEIKDNWDAMGMRPTGSNDVSMTDVFVPDDFVIMQRPAGVLDDFAIRAHRWFDLTFAAVYIGVAAGACRHALRHARERVRKPSVTPISHSPGVQFQAAEMEIALTAARSVVRQTAVELGSAPTATARQLAKVLVAKHIATDNAVRVVDMAMSVLGGLGYLKRTPIERLYRDVRAGKVHPPTGYDALEIIGKAVLDIPLDVEPRWS
jgi:alkylation response protein AidB-like acyl-CoA dehydrogenase